MTALQTPAGDAPAAEWGALAVSIPDWRWLPGMVASIGAVASRVDDIAHPWPMDVRSWPDPDDPATAGCLWELAGRPEVMVERGGKRVRVWDGKLSLAIHWSCCGPTLGRALIAYAAANGRWPGGDS